MGQLYSSLFDWSTVCLLSNLCPFFHPDPYVVLIIFQYLINYHIARPQCQRWYPSSSNHLSTLGVDQHFTQRQRLLQVRLDWHIPENENHSLIRFIFHSFISYNITAKWYENPSIIHKPTCPPMVCCMSGIHASHRLAPTPPRKLSCWLTGQDSSRRSPRTPWSHPVSLLYLQFTWPMDICRFTVRLVLKYILEVTVQSMIPRQILTWGGCSTVDFHWMDQ